MFACAGALLHSSVNRGLWIKLLYLAYMSAKCDVNPG